MKKQKLGEHFASKVLIIIAISTAVFIVMQYVSFLVTGSEQEVLTTYYFRAVVMECGAMMLKRVAEVIVGRIKKREDIEVEKPESHSGFSGFDPNDLDD